jgi:hypothetical protein
MNPVEMLESVLCGPDGKCCIHGVDEDRRIVDDALSIVKGMIQAEPAGYVNAEYLADPSIDWFGFTKHYREGFAALYIHPAPQAKKCPYGDPLCPCQDGHQCHYEGKDTWPAPQAVPVVCEWMQDPDFELGDTYHSSCGELWSFVDGGPTENRVSYCHHCGGRVKLAAPAVKGVV